MYFFRLSIALINALAFSFAPNVGLARPEQSASAYLGAIAIDASSGQTLFEDNADVLTPPASMTKLMTYAVLHDMLERGSIRLDTPVTVTAADSRIGGTQVWLKENEIFPVEELIYAMMIQSANDASFALARATAGSVEAFIEQMNAKARSIGMTRTTFRTPHGLPPSNRRKEEGDLTTPRDFARLSRYLVTHTDVTKYTSVRSRPFGANRPTGPVAMNNHNRLLALVLGLDGLKTGFTNGAGFCLAATAERQGRRVIVIAMGSPDSKVRDIKVKELMEKGFATLPFQTAIASPNTPLGPTPATVPEPSKTPKPMPVVVTDKSQTQKPATDPVSTNSEPAVTFRVIPPKKSP